MPKIRKGTKQIVRFKRSIFTRWFKPEKTKAVISEKKKKATIDALEMEALAEVERRNKATGRPPMAVVPLTHPENKPTEKLNLLPE